MDISQVTTSSTAMAADVRNLQAITEAQMEVMKTIADGEQQMAAMLQAAGVGQNINVHA